MTDKELIKQAYDALDKITDMFEAVNGRCVIGGDDVYDSAVKVMVKLNEWLNIHKALAEQPAQRKETEQEPVAWVYPEGLDALKAGKPWTAYGTRQEPDNTALYLSPQPDIPPYGWVTFTPYGEEDDVWYENPEGQLLEGWTYKPLYDTTPPQRTWVGLTDEEVSQLIDNQIGFNSCCGWEHEYTRAVEAKIKEKNR